VPGREWNTESMAPRSGVPNDSRSIGVDALQYRAEHLRGPLTPRFAAGWLPGPAGAPTSAEVGPSLVVAIPTLLMLAVSSIVMFEPAPCDILFPAVLAVTLATGHMVSPLRLPKVFLVSILVFALANYASMVSAWQLGAAVKYIGVTIYLLLLFVFLAGFIGKFGLSAVSIVRDGYLLAAALAAGIGLLASLHILPNSEIFFRDAAMLRIKSTFKDPNVFAPFLVGGVFLALPSLLHEERVRVRYLAVIALCLAGITLAFSRGAYIHFAVSLIVYAALELLIIQDRLATRRLLAGFVFVTPILVGGLLVLLASDPERSSYLQRRLSLQGYDQGRFSNQFAVLQLANQNAFGIGPGQYASPRFTLAVHNLYLRVLVENGVVGLLSFLVLVASSLFYGLAGVLRRSPYAGMYAACFAVVSGIMVESLVIDTLHWRHFFVFLGIPVGLSLYELVDRERPRAPVSSFLQSWRGAP
jgi:O-antigen ligase